MPIFDINELLDSLKQGQLETFKAEEFKKTEGLIKYKELSVDWPELIISLSDNIIIIVSNTLGKCSSVLSALDISTGESLILIDNLQEIFDDGDDEIRIHTLLKLSDSQFCFSYDNVLRIWELDIDEQNHLVQAKEISSIEAHELCITSLAKISSGKIVTADACGIIKIWSVFTSHECEIELKDYFNRTITSIVELSNGYLAVGGQCYSSSSNSLTNLFVKIFDIKTQECVAIFDQGLRQYKQARLKLLPLKNGCFAILNSQIDNLKIINSETGEEIANFPNSYNINWIADLAQLPNNYLVSASDKLKIWDLQQQQCVEEIDQEHITSPSLPIACLAILPNGNLLYGAKKGLQLYRWEKLEVDLQSSDISPLIYSIGNDYPSVVKELSLQGINLYEPDLIHATGGNIIYQYLLNLLLSSTSLRQLDLTHTNITNKQTYEIWEICYQKNIEVRGLAFEEIARTAISKQELPFLESVMDKININHLFSYTLFEERTHYTLLHLAVETSTAEIVQYLLEKGADYKQVNHQGLKPADLAEHLRKFDIKDSITSYKLASKLANLGLHASPQPETKILISSSPTIPRQDTSQESKTYDFSL